MPLHRAVWMAVTPWLRATAETTVASAPPVLVAQRPPRPIAKDLHRLCSATTVSQEGHSDYVKGDVKSQ